MIDVRDKKAHTAVLTFSSALEAHQWGVATLESEWDGCNYLSSQDRGRVDDSWSKTADFAASVEFARNGWEAGTADMLKTVKEIEAHEDMVPRGYEWDVTGDLFDVGEVIQGTPECWLTPSYEPAPRVINICVNITQSHTVSARQIQNRGAALMALIDRLQGAPGIIVDLTFHATFGHSRIAGNGTGGIVTMMFPVGTSPLPMQEIGFMIAHPAMFRRGCFAVVERVSGYHPVNNYGSVENLPREEQAKYSLYLGSEPTFNGIAECDTVDGAVRWINRQLVKLGL